MFTCVCVCVSECLRACEREMCDEDLQSWGWTDLCVPPHVAVAFLPLPDQLIVLSSVNEARFIDSSETETLTQTFMAAFTLVIPPRLDELCPVNVLLLSSVAPYTRRPRSSGPGPCPGAA